MRSLNIIQTLSKIGKILSKIVYICCIVGICGCAVGAVGMLVGEYEVIKLKGMTLHAFLQSEAGVSTGTVWAAVTGGAVLCFGRLFVSKKAYELFKNELEVGTPFTVAGANELFRFGIIEAVAPLVATITAKIACEIIGNVIENTESLELSGGGSIGIGFMFVLLSLVCRYGAELHEIDAKKNTDGGEK